MLDLEDCILAGSAITAPFLRDGLARVLDLGRDAADGWESVRLSLRIGGAERVHRHVTMKLASAFGYGRPVRQSDVTTREGPEDGGWLLRASGGKQLRAWSIPSDVDLDGLE
jgi:hypothetical protein